MASGKLDFTSLRNALIRLDEGYQRYLLDTSDIQIRDGLIHTDACDDLAAVAAARQADSH